MQFIKKSPTLRKMTKTEQISKTSYKKTISVWSILIFLTLLVLVGNYYGSGQTNAKYVRKITGNASKTRVACFVSEVTSLTGKDNVILSPNTTDYVECYTFVVSNEADGRISEVTMDYDLDVLITGPAGVEYRISSTDANANACNTSTDMTGNVLHTSGGVFSAGVSESHSYVIEATWKNGTHVSYENANVPITVKVTANVVQKD